jgi:hypothetical protein
MAPNTGKRPIVMIKQGVTVAADIDAIDGRIDSITKTTLFFLLESNPWGETVEE